MSSSQKQSQQQQDKQKKIMYIMENVAENGYDTSKFNKYLLDRHNGQKKVETMTYDQIVSVVQEYKKATQQKPQLQKQKSKEAPNLLERSEEDIYKKMRKSQMQDNSSTPFSRKSQLTKKISDQNLTELNNKQVTMQVLQSEVIKSGIFSSDYVVFHVQTEIDGQPEKYTVERKDSDFYSLRQLLVQQFPYMLVPPLPKVKDIKPNKKNLAQRAQELNRFLTAIPRSEVLKTSKFVYLFVTAKDRKTWKSTEKEVKFSRRIEDVISVSGQVSVEDRSDSKKFCDDVKNYIPVYAHLTKEAILMSKEVHELSDQLAVKTQRLAGTIRDLGRLFKQVKVNSQFKLFSKLADLFADTSTNLKNQGNLTKIYFNQAIKYYDQELSPLEDLVQFRDSFKSEYNKQLKELEDRKSHLFKQDPRTWGYTNGSIEDLVSKSQQLLKDKQKAYRYMLSSDTQRMQEMGEELSFFTNQCLDEVQRVGKDNGVALIGHFMDQSQMQCDYLQAQFDKWSEFVQYFNSFAWDKPVSDKKRKKKQQNDDFEIIDDFAEVDSPPKKEPKDSLADSVMNDNDYELVSVSDNIRASVRIAQVRVEQEPASKKQQKQSNQVSNPSRTESDSSETQQKDIGETLKKMLNASIISQGEPPAKATPSDGQASTQQQSTQQTSVQGSLLMAAPTVMISKKNKQSNNRRTAPLQVNQNQMPARNSQEPTQTPVSNQNRTTQPLTDGTDIQQSSESMPMFAGSGSDPAGSSSDPVASVNSKPLEQGSIKDPASLDSGSHSSTQPPAGRSSNRRSVGNLFAFDIGAAVLDQQPPVDVIPEDPKESEKNSSEEQTQRTETIVVDTFNNAPYGEIGQRARLMTELGQPFKEDASGDMRHQQRDQTITDKMKPILEQMSQVQQVMLTGDGDLEEQIREAHQRMKKVPVIEETKVNPKLAKNPVKQPSVQAPLIKPSAMAALGHLSAHQNSLGMNRQSSILRTDQLEKIQSGFISLPALKPVQAPKEQIEPKSKTMAGSMSQADQFKTETDVQRAIRKMREGGDSSDEAEMSFCQD